jgi:hypothetical protein
VSTNRKITTTTMLLQKYFCPMKFELSLSSEKAKLSLSREKGIKVQIGAGDSSSVCF